jgi:hypothetical protein
MGDGVRVYEKAGLVIAVGYFNGISDEIDYRKSEVNAIDIPVELSDNEIEIILKKNSPDSPWKKRNIVSMNQEWETEDGRLIAHYETIKHLLNIITMDSIKRANDAKKAKETEKLNGL